MANLSVNDNAEFSVKKIIIVGDLLGKDGNAYTDGVNTQSPDSVIEFGEGELDAVALDIGAAALAAKIFGEA